MKRRESFIVYGILETIVSYNMMTIRFSIILLMSHPDIHSYINNGTTAVVITDVTWRNPNDHHIYQCTWWHRSIWMRDIHAYFQLVQLKYLLRSNWRLQIQYLHKRYINGYNNNSLMNFICTENQNIKFVSILRIKV
jgi:hypothetical protein